MVEFAEHLTTLLGEMVGDAIREALTDEQDRQAANLQALLEQQNARLEEILQRQNQHHAAEMARLMERHADNLRSILRELGPQPGSAPPIGAAAMSSRAQQEAVAELQETLHHGFGEIRAGLDHNQRTLAQFVGDALHPVVQTVLASIAAPTPDSVLRELSPGSAPQHPPTARPVEVQQPHLPQLPRRDDAESEPPRPPDPTEDPTPLVDLTGRLRVEPVGALGLGRRQSAASADTGIEVQPLRVPSGLALSLVELDWRAGRGMHASDERLASNGPPPRAARRGPVAVYVR